MKTLFALILTIASFQTFAAELVIQSPQSGLIVRDKIGRVDLVGIIDFKGEEPSASNRGKVVCGSRQSSVLPRTYEWKIFNYKLVEGLNTVTCTFTRDGESNAKSIDLVWAPVNQMPKAKFSFLPLTGRAPLEVRFDGSGSRDLDGTIVHYAWNFGDGSFAEGPNPTYNYISPGTFVIELTVTDNEGGINTKSHTIFIDTPSERPLPVFSANPASGELPLQVTFDASLSSDPDGGSIRQYKIDFGDGATETSTLPYLNHTYESEGLFNAVLTVMDDEGDWSDPSVIDIQVFNPNLPPVARISTDLTEGYPPLTVNFSAEGSSDEDGTIESYTWYFPDGVIKTGKLISHEFLKSGSFNVILVVKDDKNVPAQDEITIKVGSDNVPPDLNITPGEGILRTAQPLFEISHIDSGSGVNLSTLKVYLNGQDISTRVQPGETSSFLAFTLEHPLSQGSHEIRVEVADNLGNQSVLVHRYEVQLGIITASYITGRVTDTLGTPIQGVRVSNIYAPPKTRIEVLTDAEGRYKIPFTLAGTYRLSFNKTGFTESVRTIVPAIVQDIALSKVVLAESDPVITPVSASSGGEAQNSTGSISVSFPPGSLPFDIDFQSTEFTNETSIPGPLPAMSAFTYAFDNRAGDVVWGEGKGVTFALENSLGFADGTELVMGIFDRELGRWLDSGMTITVAAGKIKNSVMGPFEIPRPFTGDINQPTICGANQSCEPPEIELDEETNKERDPEKNEDKDDYDTDCGDDISPDGSVCGSRIDTISGDLSVGHTLPSLQSSGQTHALTFAYHSTHAEPTFFSQTSLANSNPDPADGITYEISVGGMTITKEYSGSGITSKTLYRHIFPAKNAVGEYFPTGTYGVTNALTVAYSDSVYATAAYFGAPPNLPLGVLARVPLTFTNIANDRSAIINRRLSSFGSGWGLMGLERLHVDPEGTVFWENGDTKFTYFTPNPVTSLAPANLIKKKDFNDPEFTSVHTFGGVVYATDCANHSVYRVSPSGVLDRVAGNGDAGFKGDGGLATEASLNCPVFVAPAETGGFYIADKNNHRVRRVGADGRIKTIAHYKAGKPTSVSEDKMRAVYFTTDSEVMLISPRGDLLKYTSKDEGYVNAELNSPSQVFFNHHDYPMIVDQNNGRIITLYPQNKSYLTVFGGVSQKDSKGKEIEVKPRSVSFDPVTKNYYLLDAAGDVYLWGGQGAKKVSKLTSQKQKVGGGITSVAFSPETGLVYATKSSLFFGARFTKNKTNQAISYASRPGTFNTLVRNSDGTYEITTPDKVRKIFNSQGYIIAVKNPDNKNTIYQYGEGTNQLQLIQLPGGSTFEFRYDGRGYLKTVIDSAFRQTNFYMDDTGRLIRIESPDGSYKEYTYQDKLLSTEQDEDGKITEFFYNEGRLTKEIRPGNRERPITVAALKFNGELDTDGRYRVIKEQELFVSSSTFSGDCQSKGFFSGSGVLKEFVDCQGGVQTSIPNEQGLITEQRSQESRPKFFDYDSKGRQTMTQDANGLTNFSYDQIWGKLATVRDANNNVTRLSYNEMGLPSAIQDPLQFSTLMSYDDYGNLTTQTNALNQATLFEYDEKQNLKAVIDPLNQRTEYTRDLAGNITEIKDPENRITTFEFDEFNRVIHALDPLNFSTLTSYTPDGKIRSLTNAKDQTTTFDYDPTYFKVSAVTNPAGQVEQFYYDGNERISQKVNKDGSVINYQYTPNSKLSSKTSANRSVNYVYDKDGLPLEVLGSDGNYFFTYDNLARLKTAVPGYAPAFVSYSYNNRGLRSQMSVSANGVNILNLQYFYDARKLPVRMEANLAGYVIGWERFYDELGRPVTDFLSNGLKINRNFDAAGRLTYLSNENDAGEPISRFEYSHNPAGTISKIIKTFTRPDQGSIGREDFDYGYDALDRVTFASTDGNLEYDPLGNQLQRGGQYNELNQLLEDSEGIYTYTTNGNLSTKVSKITGERTEYTWDDQNYLTQVTVKNADESTKTLVQNYYDGDGRRIQKAINGVITKYVYDNEDIVAELDGSNNVKAVYLHGPGIDEPIAMARDVNGNRAIEEDEIFFFSKDHLGSVHALTDANGGVIQRYNYSAYGRTKVEKTNPSVKIVKNPYAYTSREWEEETGDYFYRARYYNPGTGRFLSEDPIGFGGGDTNLYRYVKNNPVYAADPYGENPLLLGVVGGLAGGIGAIFTAPEGQKTKAFFQGFAFGFLTTSLGAFGSTAVTKVAFGLLGAATSALITAADVLSAESSPAAKKAPELPKTSEPLRAEPKFTCGGP